MFYVLIAPLAFRVGKQIDMFTVSPGRIVNVYNRKCRNSGKSNVFQFYDSVLRI
jgi:hypothetical protein